jgi:hypothetical protein
MNITLGDEIHRYEVGVSDGIQQWIARDMEINYRFYVRLGGNLITNLSAFNLNHNENYFRIE